MKYRKKPVVIEAFQITDAVYEHIIATKRDLNIIFPGWVKDAYKGRRFYVSGSYPNNSIVLKTLEGEHEVSKNDWVIKGVKGELYPCKPDIFNMTYEKV